MKKIIIYTIIASTITIISFAQCNYLMAVKQASKTDGSDAEIEITMYKYGFNIDANDQDEPTMFTKIKAFLN